ncbi:natterin-3-like [Armigeres subalbatus]|uniref:natterin-3-like n=1 Tax=Armigeres subalbatus TaxID=124917 RepID=UPI002ED47ABC
MFSTMQAASWKHCSADAPIPPGSILAGHDIDKSPIFIGRAYHKGDHLPGKVIPSKGSAYVCYGGKEIRKSGFEVLCNGNVDWVPAKFGIVPRNAVLGGQTSTGEKLYIGRAHWMGSLTPGKVHPSHQTLYIPFDGKEISIQNYEVLVEN